MNKTNTYIEVVWTDGEYWSSGALNRTGEALTVETARELIRTEREPKPHRSDDDNAYWASRRYEIRSVTHTVELLEAVEPDGSVTITNGGKMKNPESSTYCPKCECLNTFKWTGQPNTEQCSNCGNTLIHCSSCGNPFPPEATDGGGLCTICHKEQYGAESKTPESQKMPRERRICKSCENPFCTDDAFQWECDQCEDGALPPTLTEPRTTPVCEVCGSDDVTRQSPERFDAETQRWTEEGAENAIYNCGRCGDETDVIEIDTEPTYGCVSCGRDDLPENFGLLCGNCRRGIIEWTNKPKAT
jgi:hypothetical protein